jgi:hypothetical protein
MKPHTTCKSIGERLSGTAAGILGHRAVNTTTPFELPSEEQT